MVVKRWAPSRSRTRTAASRMSATSWVERAWTGSFLGAVTGRRGRDMGDLRTRIPNANNDSYSRKRPGDSHERFEKRDQRHLAYAARRHPPRPALRRRRGEQRRGARAL